MFRAIYSNEGKASVEDAKQTYAEVNTNLQIARSQVRRKFGDVKTSQLSREGLIGCAISLVNTDKTLDRLAGISIFNDLAHKNSDKLDCINSDVCSFLSMIETFQDAEDKYVLLGLCANYLEALKKQGIHWIEDPVNIIKKVLDESEGGDHWLVRSAYNQLLGVSGGHQKLPELYEWLYGDKSYGKGAYLDPSAIHSAAYACIMIEKGDALEELIEGYKKANLIHDVQLSKDIRKALAEAINKIRLLNEIDKNHRDEAASFLMDIGRLGRNNGEVLPRVMPMPPW